MQTKLIHKKGSISLGIIPPGEKKPLVVAGMTKYDDTPCWTLTDIRLSRHREPNEFGDVPSDAFASTFKPANEAEANYAKGMLREYQEQPSGQIVWCPFDMVVRGHPDIDGKRPVKAYGFHGHGYFSREEGLQQLETIQAFWDAYDPATYEAEGVPRLANPNAQPSEVTLSLSVFIKTGQADQESGNDPDDSINDIAPPAP